MGGLDGLVLGGGHGFEPTFLWDALSDPRKRGNGGDCN
jgi:hypothetical protein